MHGAWAPGEETGRNSSRRCRLRPDAVQLAFALTQMPMPDPLQRIRVVLSHPSHPGNVGATARALKTMGLTRLVLVNPRRFPDPQADARASNALDVLNAAAVCASLPQALEGTSLAVATVSHGYAMTHGMVDCREAAARAVAVARAGAEVALVFGTEKDGLSAEEVMSCNLLAHVPANPDYSSLNLAAAVQVFAYELRMAAGAPLPATDLPLPASHESIERLHAHLEEVLVALGYLDPAHPKKLRERLRRLVARAALEEEEVNVVRGFLKQVLRRATGD
jgi:tRNA/rRNA methyltransferase